VNGRRNRRRNVAKKGGTYFVTYGLIIVGAVKMLQGLFMVIVG